MQHSTCKKKVDLNKKLKRKKKATPTCHSLYVASEDGQSLVAHAGHAEADHGEEGAQTQKGTAPSVEHTGRLPGIGGQVGEVEEPPVNAAHLRRGSHPRVAHTVRVHPERVERLRVQEPEGLQEAERAGACHHQG